MSDRVSLKNFKPQTIKPKKWTLLVDENGVTEVLLDEGSTTFKVWVSFDQPALASRPQNYQFVIVRRDGQPSELPGVLGDITQRESSLMPTINDVGLGYDGELWSDGQTALSIFFWLDAKVDVIVDGYEAHYKHIPGPLDVTVTVAAPKATAVVTER